MAESSLDEYHKKRDFQATPEPSGDGRPGEGEPIFVIQKHEASTMHYDFRIEVEGVLKSWAIPKGPSADPSDKRLAIPTEDHPIEYADFEGKIPEGHYGAGTVIVWDRGTYRNLKEEMDVVEALEKGHLNIWLEGKKLRGGFAFIRTGKTEKARWLLVKMRDQEANAGRDPVKAEPESVVSGRTIEEIGSENP